MEASTVLAARLRPARQHDSEGPAVRAARRRPAAAPGSAPLARAAPAATAQSALPAYLPAPAGARPRTGHGQAVPRTQLQNEARCFCTAAAERGIGPGTLGRRRVACGAAAAGRRIEPVRDEDLPPDCIRLLLPPAEARASLRFAQGRLDPSVAGPSGADDDVPGAPPRRAIVLEAVAVGCSAAAAGATPGQRLLAVSDPIRYDVMWPVAGGASLAYLRDAIRLRRADVRIILEGRPQYMLLDDTSSSSPSLSELLASPSPAREGAMTESDASPGNGGAESPSPSGSPGPSALPSAVQRRIQKRKDYLEVVGERDDRPLVLGLFSAFALPPLIILGFAASQGWLQPGYWLAR